MINPIRMRVLTVVIANHSLAVWLRVAMNLRLFPAVGAVKNCKNMEFARSIKIS
jgi:hypothetical protein